MKKLISIILAALLTLALTIPAFADHNYSDIRTDLPTIVIAGDGEKIYYNNDQDNMRVDGFISEIGKFDGNSDSEENPVAKAAINILTPMVLEGFAFNEWDDYYAALEAEVSDILDPIRLDENGNPKGDSGIASWRKQDNLARMTNTNYADANGTFHISNYQFWYDWRLDPFESAASLHEFIQGVKQVTGKPQVNIISRCLGTSVVFAYISEYGTDDIHGWGIDGSSIGSEFITGALSGSFDINGNALARTLTDYNSVGKTDIPPVIIDTFSLLENAGVLKGLSTALKKTIYVKIEKGVVSAISLGLVFTMPCYWSMVSADKYETCKEYVFGPEGSEKRKQYAGLIEKTDHFQSVVSNHLEDILHETQSEGVNIGIVSKYGFNIMPFIKDNELVSDAYASVKASSFGATTSKIRDTLSKSYIAKREAEGKGKYISPDKQIDASTCALPENTWFLKGANHVDWVKGENELLLTVVDADVQLTTEDTPSPRFCVYDYDTDLVSPMTEENCKTESWSDDEFADTSTKQGRLRAFLTSLFKFVKSFFELVVDKIKK